MTTHLQLPLHRPWRATLAAASVAGLGLLAGLAAACGPSTASQEATRGEIEELLHAYLPVLAEYYRTGEPGAAETYAFPKEVDHVNRWILTRARDEGHVVDPTLESVEIEQLNVYQPTNAILTTQEIWDLRIRAAGSGRVIQEELGKLNRFRYQLKRDDDGRWRVLSREVVEP